MRDYDIRSAPVYSFAGRGMIMMMLPKQIKPVWREKQNKTVILISL